MNALRPTRKLMGIACAVAIFFAAATLNAQADDLTAEKSRIDAAVTEAQSSVDQSSATLQAANDRVMDAQARVADAQATLNAAQAEVDKAQALADQKAAELEQANKELADAQAKEADGQAKVDAQKEAVNAYARAVYQDNLPLISVATLINTSTTATLANRVQWTDTVLTTNQVDLDNLRILQDELAAARANSELAQARADEAQQEADAQLEATQIVEQAAQDARDELQAALDEQQQAQAAAQDALNADQAQLAQMQAEQADVNARIAEAARQAEEARRAAAAAEAAAAAAQSSQGGGSSAVSSSGLIWPVNGPITDYYGYRIHPIYGTRLFHDGLDIGVGCGVPIKAPASGRVSEEYYSSGYGYRLFIDHGWVGGQYMVTSYNHMSGYAVPVGTWVSQGQTVGYVGTTGASTGCHLHLMIWVGGTMTNVLSYLP